jgi:hypothetical protein
MLAQIKCETFAHKYRIFKKNYQQKSQILTRVPTGQNFYQNLKPYSNTLFSWLSDLSIHKPLAHTQ